MPNPQNVLAHRWKPGCPSPNPQGRRSDKTLVDHVLAATRDGAELGDLLLSIARHAKRDTDRIEAATVLLDRCYGKIAPGDRDSLFESLKGAREVIRFAASFGPPTARGEATDDAVEVEAVVEADSHRVDMDAAESDAADAADTPETPVE
jgi:hypothetical protein